MDSLSKRLRNNFGARFYALSLSILIQLFSIPIFLNFWNNAEYGEWLVLSAMASYLSISDIGFGKVASNKMAILVAGEKYDEAETVLHSACLFILLVSLFVILILGLFVALFPLSNWLGLQHISPRSTKITIVFLTLYTLLCLQGELFGAVYRSAFAVARGVFLTQSFRLFDFLITTAIISTTTSTVYLSLGLVFSRMMANCFLFLDCSKISSHLNIGLSRAKWAEVRSMFRPSLAFMCFPIAHSIPSQAMTLIINGILGPAAVVIFNAVRIFTRTLIQATNLIKAAVWPEISHLIATGDLKRARRIHRLIIQSTLSFSIVGAVLFLFFGKNLISLWTHGSVYINTTTMSIFVLGVTINSIWLSSAVVLEATNLHEGLAIRCLAGSLVSIIFAIFFVPWLGIDGAAWAPMISDCVLISYVLRTSCKILRDSPREIINKFDLAAFKIRA